MRETPEVRSARGHVEMFTQSVARRRRDMEDGAHQIDEATTRRWLAYDEEQLAQWTRALKRAEDDAKPVVPIA